MANFPTSLDSFADEEDGVSYPTASDMNTIYDAIEKLEAKVGIDSSAVTTSHDYKIAHITPWPVDSVYLSYSATNPASTIGYGTWTQIAQGQMLVGQKGSDTDFDNAGDTGGAKTHTLAATEMPYHTHIQDAHYHAFGYDDRSKEDGSHDVRFIPGGVDGYYNTNNATATNQYAGGTGGVTQAHNNMPPWFTVYIWKRTA